MVTEDILGLTAQSRYSIVQSNDFSVSKIKPEIDERAARRIVAQQVVQDNVTQVDYEVRVTRGEYEKHKMNVTPRLSEVAANRISLIYVPSWDLEFESGNKTYSRTILASSGRTIEDEIAICPEHYPLGSSS